MLVDQSTSQQTDLTALPVPTPTGHMGIGLWIIATLCFH